MAQQLLEGAMPFDAKFTNELAIINIVISPTKACTGTCLRWR